MIWLPLFVFTIDTALIVFPCVLCALVVCRQTDLSGSGRYPSYICFFDFIWNNKLQLGAPPCTTLKCFLYFRASVSGCLVGVLFNMVSSWVCSCLDSLAPRVAIWTYLFPYINCYIEHFHHPQLILVGESLRQSLVIIHIQRQGNECLTNEWCHRKGVLRKEPFGTFALRERMSDKEVELFFSTVDQK